jgi:hypothetical protein
VGQEAFGGEVGLVVQGVDDAAALAEQDAM